MQNGRRPRGEDRPWLQKRRATQKFPVVVYEPWRRRELKRVHKISRLQSKRCHKKERIETLKKECVRGGGQDLCAITAFKTLCIYVFGEERWEKKN
jgi:hypothetical protein